MTQCDVIAALSDQLPIKVSLERRFIRFIKKCLSSSNSIVNVISQIAICNPMSTAGKNYRSVLDANGDYNNNQTVTSWQYTCESIKESIRTLRELIDVRDGYSLFFFIYNQIPPQSEENSILHKNSIDKILVKQVYLT